MPAVYRNVTRTIKNSTETTLKTQTPASDTVDFALTTGDKFFIGFKERFSTRYFDLDTVNATTSAVTVKYFNGTSFVPILDLIDQTIGFTRSGFISWTNKEDWQKSIQAPISDVELFWIELTVGTNLDGGTTLQTLVNIFNDDLLLRQYYPELVSDSRYLPVGRTNFMDQFIAAKNRVVLRLKRDELILDESEIIDINEVAIAATHATAAIILMAIAVDEINRERATAADDAMNYELSKVKLDLDFDNTGVIDESEENQGNIVRVRG